MEFGDELPETDTPLREVGIYLDSGRLSFIFKSCAFSLSNWWWCPYYNSYGFIRLIKVDRGD